MCSADFGWRVRSRGTSVALPLEYSRCTRSTNSRAIGMVRSFSTSDSRSRRAMARGESREGAILYNPRMKTVSIAAFLFVSCATALAQAPAAAPPAKPDRLALVFGNAAYKDAPLVNPLNDAADMEKALKASGFTVIRRDNATLRDMHLALREFGDRLGRQSTGLVYFSGHGLQVRGRNYLL